MTEMINSNVDELYTSISLKIRETKSKTVKAVNSAMVLLYWNIGKIINDDILKNNRAEYGKNIIEILSDRLTIEYGKGFDKSAISRMVKFYQEFNDERIVVTLSQQLTWSHFIELLPISDDIERNFYANMSLNEQWSIRDLRDRKKSMLYQRTAISKKPDELIKEELDVLRTKKTMSTDLFYRDPYVLDFLALNDTYSEKDLENAILVELEKFILEMGNDFAFLARQKHIVIDGKDYYIDLLFFHRTLNRLVLIELKLGEFEPQDKGQTDCI